MTREERLCNIAQNVVQRLLESNKSKKVLKEADEPEDIFSKARKELGIAEFEREAQKQRPPEKKPSYASRINREIERLQGKLSTSDPTVEKVRPTLQYKSLKDDPFYGKYFTFDSNDKPKLSTNPSQLEKELFWIRDFVESQLQLVNDRDIEKYLKDVLYLEDEIVDRILDLPSEPLSEKEKKFLILNDIIEFNRDEQKLELVFSSDPAEKEKQMSKLREFIAVFDYSDSDAKAKLEGAPFNLSSFTINKIMKLPLVTTSPAAFEKELAKPKEKVLTPSDIGPIVRYIKSQNLSSSAAKMYLKEKQKFTDSQIQQVFNVLYKRKEEAEEENLGTIRAIRTGEEVAAEGGPRKYGSAEEVWKEFEPRQPSQKGARRKDMVITSEMIRYPYATGKKVKTIGGENVFFPANAREDQVHKDRWEWVIGKELLEFIFNAIQDGASAEDAKQVRLQLIDNLSAEYPNVSKNEFRDILLPNPKSPNIIDYGPVDEKISVVTNTDEKVDLKVISTWSKQWPAYYAILRYFLKEPNRFHTMVEKLTTSKGQDGIPYYRFTVNYSDIFKQLNVTKLRGIVPNPYTEKFEPIGTQKEDLPKSEDDPFKSIKASLRPLPTETPQEFAKRQDLFVKNILDSVKLKHFKDVDELRDFLKKTYSTVVHGKVIKHFTDKQADEIINAIELSSTDLNKIKQKYKPQFKFRY